MTGLKKSLTILRMESEAKHTVLVNGLYAEVYAASPEENYWGSHKIYIYDALSDLADVERDSIVNYLYEEGFIDDRRTKCEVVRGEDYL